MRDWYRLATERRDAGVTKESIIKRIAWGFADPTILPGPIDFNINFHIDWKKTRLLMARRIHANNNFDQIEEIYEKPEVIVVLIKPISKVEEYVDNFAAVIELEDVMRDIQILLTHERDTFGRNGAMISRITEVFQLIAMDANFAKTRMRQNIPYSMVRYLKELNNYKITYDTLKATKLELGRRCVNDDDYFSLDEVDDILADNFIRLESGVGWDIESLHIHIREVNGQNDIVADVDYPGDVLWQDEEELQRILRHPISISSGFTEWYQNRNFAEAAVLISLGTLNIMYETASILSSKGQPYLTALLTNLNAKQKQAYNKAGGNIRRVQPFEIKQEIEFTRAITIKSAATANMWNYYHQLSNEEKRALAQFDRDLEKNLNACYNNEYCVFGLGGQLIATRNTIARIKEIPVIDLNVFD